MDEKDNSALVPSPSSTVEQAGLGPKRLLSLAVAETLALEVRGTGYDFEAEMLLRAVWAGLDVIEEPVRVLYPEERRTHFRVSRDPWLILRTVLATVGEHWLSPARRSSTSPRGPRPGEGRAG